MQYGWPRYCHIESSKSDREGEISYNIPYMWNLKRHDTNELVYKTEIDRLREWTYGYQGEERGWEIGSFGSTCTHCYIWNG